MRNSVDESFHFIIETVMSCKVCLDDRAEEKYSYFNNKLCKQYICNLNNGKIHIIERNCAVQFTLFRVDFIM